MGATVIDDVSLLKVSTQPRSGTPDGNIHFNTTTGLLEIIIDSELATVDFGAGPVANPLTLDAKPGLRAIYELQQAERQANEDFRKFRPFLRGRFKLGKAFDFENGRSAGPDRSRIAASGWREFGGPVGEQLNRIYFNVSSLPSILDTSQGYGQLSPGGETFEFSRPGAFDEAIQIYGTTANGDTGAGDFDDRTYLAVSVRTYGQRHARVILNDFGISELEGYGTLAALGESPHPTTGNYAEADVYGVAQVAPFDGLSFEVLSTPETKTGFNQADGDFSLIIRNASGANLDQVVAWIDAASAQDANIASVGTWNGKQREQLYSFDADGVPEFIQGVYIENLPASDLQRLKIFDDSGASKTFPFIPFVEVDVPPVAQNTTTGYFHCWVLDGAGGQDYNSDGAVTMLDNLGGEVKGMIGASTKIQFGVDFDNFNLAGLTPGEDFSILFTIGSDGEFEEQSVVIQVSRTAVITATVPTVAESNI